MTYGAKNSEGDKIYITKTRVTVKQMAASERAWYKRYTGFGFDVFAETPGSYIVNTNPLSGINGIKHTGIILKEHAD